MVSEFATFNWRPFHSFLCLRHVESLTCLCDAATDDTQRMMQMSGFGFDPSKVNEGMKD